MGIPPSGEFPSPKGVCSLCFIFPEFAESVTVSTMKEWFRNVWIAVYTVLHGMLVTLRTMGKTYGRRTFTEVYEYPEVPVPVKARYRGFHRST